MSAITNETQALVAGRLMGLMMLEAAKYNGDPNGDKGAVLAVTDVRPEMDEEGNYLPSCIVTFKSGTVLCISVNEVTDIPEEM